MIVSYSEWWILVILILLSIPASLITVLIKKHLLKKKLNKPKLSFAVLFVLCLFLCYMAYAFYYSIKMDEMRQRVYEMDQIDRR